MWTSNFYIHVSNVLINVQLWRFVNAVLYTFLFCYNSKVILLFCYNSYIIFFVISPGEGSRGPADVPALSVSTRTADRRPGVLQGLLVISSRVKSHKGWTLKEIRALDQSMSDINLFILFIYFFTWDHLFCCLFCVSGVCVLIVSL